MRFRVACKNRVIPLRRDGTALEDVPEKQGETPDSHDDNANSQDPFVSPLIGQAEEKKANAQLYQPHIRNVRRSCQRLIFQRLDLIVLRK